MTTFFSGKDLPNNVKRMLNTYGDEEITNIIIARRPLSTGTKILLNIASAGNFQKRLNELPYDKIFHLFLIITTSKGKVILEKNELINMKKYSKITSNTETKTINSIPKGLTLNKLMEKTKTKMGDKFTSYMAKDNNCQNFVSSVLLANNLGGDVRGFVNQDIEHLFKDDVRFRKIVNTTTDLGGLANRINQIPIVNKITTRLTSPASDLVKPIYDKLNIVDKLKEVPYNPFMKEVEKNVI